MKSDKISESGVISADGQLRIPMDRLKACFAEHKGERVAIRFYFSVPGSSAAQQSYYRNYVLPTIQQALLETGDRKSEQAVDRFLIEQYPGDKSILATDIEAVKAAELNMVQMYDFLEWVKQWAAEPPLSVYVDDPRTI